MKKRLTQSEEFEVMKLVLDKFLLLGFGVMGYGLYVAFSSEFTVGIMWMIIGAILLITLMVLIVKEFEIIR